MAPNCMDKFESVNETEILNSDESWTCELFYDHLHNNTVLCNHQICNLYRGFEFEHMISHFDYCEEDEEKCELCILYFKFMEIEKIQKSDTQLFEQFLYRFLIRLRSFYNLNNTTRIV